MNPLLDKVYKKLSFDERFGASLEALSRHDLTEAEKLVMTSPDGKTRLRCASSLEKIADIALCVRHDVLEHLCAAQRIRIEMALLMARLASGSPQAPGSGDERLAQLDACRRGGLGKLMAWSAFCVSIGIDTAIASRAFDLDRQGTIGQSLEDIRAYDFVEDPQADQEYFDRLREVWSAPR